jgi:hypothetical protein
VVSEVRARGLLIFLKLKFSLQLTHFDLPKDRHSEIVSYRTKCGLDRDFGMWVETVGKYLLFRGPRSLKVSDKIAERFFTIFDTGKF